MNDLISWYSENYEKDILDNMTERGKNRTIITLYQQLAEKDAMIDWLAGELEKTGWRCRLSFQWISLAQEAVKNE